MYCWNTLTQTTDIRYITAITVLRISEKKTQSFRAYTIKKPMVSFLHFLEYYSYNQTYNTDPSRQRCTCPFSETGSLLKGKKRTLNAFLVEQILLTREAKTILIGSSPFIISTDAYTITRQRPIYRNKSFLQFCYYVCPVEKCPLCYECYIWISIRLGQIAN